MPRNPQASPVEASSLSAAELLDAAFSELKRLHDGADTSQEGVPQVRGTLAWCLNNIEAHQTKVKE